MKTYIITNAKMGIMLGLLLLRCLAWSPDVSADIHSWTDSNGVIHFSNHSPPPEAEFFMVEQVQDEKDQAETAVTAEAKAQDTLRDQLDEANRKLEKALDKVDDLTEKVEETRREARDASDAAKQARAEAKIAAESRSEKTVVYGVPYKRRPHHPRPTPYYWRPHCPASGTPRQRSRVSTGHCQPVTNSQPS